MVCGTRSTLACAVSADYAFSHIVDARGTWKL